MRTFREMFINEGKEKIEFVAKSDWEDTDKERLALLFLARNLKIKDISLAGGGNASNGFKDLMKLDVKATGIVKTKIRASYDKNKVFDGFKIKEGSTITVTVDKTELDKIIDKYGIEG